MSALALLDASRKPVNEATYPSGRTFDVPAAFRDLVAREALTAVAVATGPGSFTGLRAGVSFGLGLAMGLRIPIVPLPSLRLQSARSEEPVLAVAEAERGRGYLILPGGGGGGTTRSGRSSKPYPVIYYSGVGCPPARALLHLALRVCHQPRAL